MAETQTQDTQVKMTKADWTKLGNEFLAERRALENTTLIRVQGYNKEECILDLSLCSLVSQSAPASGQIQSDKCLVIIDGVKYHLTEDYNCILAAWYVVKWLSKK